MRGRVKRIDRTHTHPGHRPVMSKQVDVRELARARQVISALAHPDTRTIADTAMGTLHAAFSGGGLQVSKIPGLQHAIRKHVRQAWMDGIVAPLARSRNPADRAVLDAIPKAFALGAHAEVSEALERISRWVPEDADATRAHVERAFAYLRTLPPILQALADLEGLARVDRPASGSDGAEAADLSAMARRKLKAALARGLPFLVNDLSEAVYRGSLGATGTPSLRWTGAALLAPPARGARRSDRGGPQWRRSLANALSRDLLDEALAPAADRLLRRHAGLKIGSASYARGEGHGGRLDLALCRNGVRLLLSVRFDLGSGQFEQSTAAVTLEGTLRPLRPEGADALLDASIPAALDTPAHRALRRLARRDGPSLLRMNVTATGELLVGLEILDVPRPPDEALLTELVRTADEEGSDVRFAPGRDMVLASGLIQLGFAWQEGPDGRSLLRSPAEPSSRLRQ